MTDKAEKLKAGLRAKVEHPFRVIKRQFGFVKVRYRGLKKKHSAAGDAVCLVQFVDGARQIDGGSGVSAPANRAKALQSAKRAQRATENDAILRDIS